VVVVAEFAELASTRWEMPAKVFPPEGFGSCAIAGEKFMAASKVTVAPASNRVFISHSASPHMFERSSSRAISAVMTRESGIAVR
jgi:hypothetical protein